MSIALKTNDKALKRSLLVLLLVVNGFNLFAQSSTQRDDKLWYKQPAASWTEALPVGNGRLGAMVFGGADEELLQLNEATLWSGGPVKRYVDPNANSNLADVRKALFRQDYQQAHNLIKKIQGAYTESYLPLGNVTIKQDMGDAKPSAYRRELDIANAIATTQFKLNDVSYKRQLFVSAPDQVIVMKLTCSKPGKLNIVVKTTSPLHSQHQILSGRLLRLNGKAPAHVDPSYVNYNKEPIIYDDGNSCAGMPFDLLVKATSNDGVITADSSKITITNASEITLYISAATGFKGFNNCPDGDAYAAAIKYLNGAAKKTYGQLLAAHLIDFHKYYNRVDFGLNPKRNPIDSPTDERLAAYTHGAVDPGLEALYFKYGRYLLISSSRLAGVPANLQGIWNKEMRAPWSSNYTTNINVQMNYWMAEDCNLSEMHTPLFGLIQNLSVTGKQAATDFYHAAGWVTHHNSDIWARANPVGDFGKGDPKWANWTMGGNWLTRDLWEHYLFTSDKKFLASTAYPLMKGAALFTCDWLIPDSAGHLVTAPSMSPENDFIYDGKKVADVSISSTMDMGIIRDLFDNVIAASKILGVDVAFRDSLIAKKAKLLPYQIGSKGQLQEWFKDYESTDPHHRHVSHLYSLYPANEISVNLTPELANAAKTSLLLRGDDGTGWSLAWKVNLWARLKDGNHAYSLYRNLMRLTHDTGTDYSHGGGIYPNMFDAHPPFQIDGNFGGTSGLAEMLLQSQDGVIELLPALPTAWPTGFVNGLVARGAFIVNINWEHSKVNHSQITSKNGGLCKVKSSIPLQIKGSNVRSVKSGDGYLLIFNSVKGRTYFLSPTYG